jgi:hypothetical protein
LTGALTVVFRSDDYTNRVNGQPTPKKGRKALLLCKVVVGRTAKIRTMNSQLHAPPRGFDSVCGLSQFHLSSEMLRQVTGEAGVFAGLKYDEVVVYRPAAALPAYVIVYE